jgi:hypothetical protein
VIHPVLIGDLIQISNRQAELVRDVADWSVQTGQFGYAAQRKADLE